MSNAISCKIYDSISAHVPCLRSPQGCFKSLWLKRIHLGQLQKLMSGPLARDLWCVSVHTWLFSGRRRKKNASQVGVFLEYFDDVINIPPLTRETKPFSTTFYGISVFSIVAATEQAMFFQKHTNLNKGKLGKLRFKGKPNVLFLLCLWLSFQVCIVKLQPKSHVTWQLEVLSGRGACAASA